MCLYIYILNVSTYSRLLLNTASSSMTPPQKEIEQGQDARAFRRELCGGNILPHVHWIHRAEGFRHSKVHFGAWCSGELHRRALSSKPAWVHSKSLSQKQNKTKLFYILSQIHSEILGRPFSLASISCLVIVNWTRLSPSLLKVGQWGTLRVPVIWGRGTASRL